MGLGKILWNVISGKPAFDVPPPQQQQPPHEHALEPDQPGESPSPHASLIAPPSPGPKVLPLMRLQDRVECRLEGDNMVCEIRIRNYSQKPLTVYELEFMGRTVPVQGSRPTLKPGSELEVIAFNGRRQTSVDADAKLKYVDESGDYFSTHHHIDTERLEDGTYKVVRVRYLEFHDDHAV